MASNDYDELVKRIAKLARQNQELEDHIKKLEKQNEKLTSDNEKLKARSERASPETPKDTEEGEKKEKSLKFNMATVLFADIHGFSKLNEGMDSSAIMDELDEILYEFDSIVNKYKIENSVNQ